MRSKAWTIKHLRALGYRGEFEKMMDSFKGRVFGCWKDGIVGGEWNWRHDAKITRRFLSQLQCICEVERVGDWAVRYDEYMSG